MTVSQLRIIRNGLVLKSNRNLRSHKIITYHFEIFRAYSIGIVIIAYSGNSCYLSIFIAYTYQQMKRRCVFSLRRYINNISYRLTVLTVTYIYGINIRITFKTEPVISVNSEACITGANRVTSCCCLLISAFEEDLTKLMSINAMLKTRKDLWLQKGTF